MLPTTITPDNVNALNDATEFDHPFSVHPADESGAVTITDGPPSLYAPSLIDGELDDDRWAFVDGYSGQYSYGGPIMHDSEFLGGGMARDVLEQPGTYVLVAAQYLCTDEEHANGDPVSDEDPRETWTDDAGVVHIYVNHDACESYWEGWALLRLSE